MGSCPVMCGRFFVPGSELERHGKCPPCYEYDNNNWLMVNWQYTRVKEIPTPPNRGEWYDKGNQPTV